MRRAIRPVVNVNEPCRERPVRLVTGKGGTDDHFYNVIPPS